MRLDDLDPSKNTQDQGRGGGRTGSRGGGAGLSVLLGLLPMLFGKKKMGCGTIAIIIGIGAFLYFSGSGGQMLSSGSVGSGTGTQSANNVACDDPAELFACRVLRSTEITWGDIFQKNGQRYAAPKMVFYQGSGQSGCGSAQSAMGPFYCPADQGIYLDTSFFAELSNKFGAKGDFARAYVIAHEVGHHIQTVTGTSEQVRRAQGRASKTQGNALQVKMELQADCYAGVWANRNQDRLEPGDVEEGMRAANAIGDDTLMRAAGRRAVPESFTHGSAQQRMAWLRRGMQTGDVNSCNTFK